MDKLQKMVAQFRDVRNWRQYHTPKNLAQAIAAEVGELNDLYLWDRQPEPKKVFNEMADILIFLLSMADILEMDLSQAVINKLSINNQKYPVNKSFNNSQKYR